ncbi:phytoene desaturase family protein [Nocardia camponoti]|uniref:Phytoene dehydrogenase n=1 Tax=Nocardia camponoti TaxID=1616106 RepID=A0A917VDZ6_9NOCA|nr:phytoene desaturase family protein [Nocardia camponoti]GGK66317.1 phytoene dehydrogenase [Nocardia camponoti]
MKIVAGQVKSVVVIGAGLSGLAAALHLRGVGYAVTVLERADHVGGRAGRYQFDDYEIDSGATILTMPELIDDALAAVGHTRETVHPPLRITRMSPAYHARFADGSDIRVFDDVAAMTAEVARACGRAEARGYRRLRTWLARIYDAEFAEFMDANFDSPLDMVSIPAAANALGRLIRLGGFGRLGPRVRSYLSDERLARLFTFQALFAGTVPNKALALYGAIPHMDTSLGVFYPEGGMRAITVALADAFVRSGGVLVLGADVHRVDYATVRESSHSEFGIDSRGASHRTRRAEAVRTTDGRLFECDALIVTADLGSLKPLGLKHRRGLRASPSAVVAHGTIPAHIAAQWPVQAHHTIDFGAEWDRTFTEIAAKRGKGKLMSDPSLLLTRPALTDATQFVDRADGRYEPLSLLAPCPNLDAAPLDWARLGPAYLRELLAELERRGYVGIAEHFTVDHLDTPTTWSEQGMIAGTPFSIAHLFRQTGPFRPSNMSPASIGIDNVVLAGCGTTPGVGVPTTLLSGRLAAARITGDRTHVGGDLGVSVAQMKP